MFLRTEIEGLLVATPRRLEDERGFFAETFRQSWLQEAGVEAVFVQQNLAHSKAAGVMRGLHYQVAPMEQGKLVHAVRGAILDVAVDLRASSPTRGRHLAFELSASNLTQLWIPPGFAHGYLTLEADTEVGYMTTAYYDPASERGIAFDDPDIAIQWPIPISAMTISSKDRALPRLVHCEPGRY